MGNRLNEPVARALCRHLRGTEALFGPLYDVPRIIAALSEREREFQRIRSEVRDMLFRTGWN